MTFLFTDQFLQLAQEIIVEETETSPGATQGSEEIQATLAEADPTVPGTGPERMLEGLHTAGPTMPIDIMIPTISVQSEYQNGKFISNSDIFTYLV